MTHSTSGTKGGLVLTAVPLDEYQGLKAEVKRLRAELAALRPVAEAAVKYYRDLDSDDDESEEFMAAVEEYVTDFISRRANAQAASAAKAGEL